MKISQSIKCQELWTFLQVQSQKPSSALMRTATGNKRPKVTSAQINASQSSSNRHISTSTVQRRLHESGLHGRIAAKKPLQKDTNNKKRLALAKKHEQWTLDWWKSVLWSDESKFEIFGSNRRVFVRRRVGELHVWFPPWNMKEEVWGCGGAFWWHCWWFI